MTTPKDPHSKASQWTPERDHELTELVSQDRYSFAAIGLVMGITKSSAIGRFDRLRRNMGEQAL